MMTPTQLNLGIGKGRQEEQCGPISQSVLEPHWPLPHGSQLLAVSLFLNRKAEPSWMGSGLSGLGRVGHLCI